MVDIGVAVVEGFVVRVVGVCVVRVGVVGRLRSLETFLGGGVGWGSVGGGDGGSHWSGGFGGGWLLGGG